MPRFNHGGTVLSRKSQKTPKLTKNIQKNCKLQNNQKSKELEFLRDFFVCLFE